MSLGRGLEQIDKVVDINQSPIGRTPRSNPATYTGLFTPIRELFAATPESRSRGYTPGRFSFNVKGGRCESCRGDGVVKVEMHFLPDVFVHCDVCAGKRYNRETLEIRYKGKTINEVLEMTVEEAYVFFKPVPVLARKLQTMVDVGLTYITLGQNATTLSGGKHSGLNYPKSCPSAILAKPCIFWMNRRQVCIFRISSSYSMSCIRYVITAIPLSLSSIIWMLSKLLTG